MGYLTNDRHSDAVQNPSMSETQIHRVVMTGCYRRSLTVPMACGRTVNTASVDPQCDTSMAQGLCRSIGVFMQGLKAVFSSIVVGSERESSSKIKSKLLKTHTSHQQCRIPNRLKIMRTFKMKYVVGTGDSQLSSASGALRALVRKIMRPLLARNV
jgi:hypothetical protein